MVKLEVLRETIKQDRNSGYSLSINISLDESESIIKDLVYAMNDAEREIRDKGVISYPIDFKPESNFSINLYFREENISQLKGIIEHFRDALELSIKRRIAQERVSKELEIETERRAKETLERIKQMNFEI